MKAVKSKRSRSITPSLVPLRARKRHTLNAIEGLPLPVNLQGSARRPMSEVPLLAHAPADGRPTGRRDAYWDMECVMVGKGTFGSNLFFEFAPGGIAGDKAFVPAGMNIFECP